MPPASWRGACAWHGEDGAEHRASSGSTSNGRRAPSCPSTRQRAADLALRGTASPPRASWASRLSLCAPSRARARCARTNKRTSRSARRLTLSTVKPGRGVDRAPRDPEERPSQGRQMRCACWPRGAIRRIRTSSSGFVGDRRLGSRPGRTACPLIRSRRTQTAGTTLPRPRCSAGVRAVGSAMRPAVVYMYVLASDRVGYGIRSMPVSDEQGQHCFFLCGWVQWHIDDAPARAPLLFLLSLADKTHISINGLFRAWGGGGPAARSGHGFT